MSGFVYLEYPLSAFKIDTRNRIKDFNPNKKGFYYSRNQHKTFKIKSISMVLGHEIQGKEYLLSTRLVLDTEPEDTIIRNAIPIYFSLQDKNMWPKEALEIIEEWRKRHIVWGTKIKSCLHCSAIGPHVMFHEEHDEQRIFCNEECQYEHYNQN